MELLFLQRQAGLGTHSQADWVIHLQEAVRQLVFIYIQQHCCRLVLLKDILK